MSAEAGVCEGKVHGVAMGRPFFLLLALFALNLLSFSQFVAEKRYQLLFFFCLAVLSGWYLYRERHRISLSSLAISLVVLACFAAHAVIYLPYENPVLILALFFFVYFLYCQVFAPREVSFDDLRTHLLVGAGFMLFFMALEVWGRYELASDILLYGESAIDYSGEIYRLSGNTSNPNRWAASIGVLVIALFALAASRNKASTWAVFLVFYLYALFSLSKTFIAASALFIAVIFVLRSKRVAPLLTAAAALACIGFFGLQFMPEEYNRRLSAGIDILLNPAESETVKERFISYERAFEELQDKPIAGVGVEGLERSPHNNLLAHYAYFGVFGIVVYLCIFVMPFLLAAQRASGRKEQTMFLVLFAYVALATSMSSLATDIAAQTNFVLCAALAINVIRICDEH